MPPPDVVVFEVGLGRGGSFAEGRGGGGGGNDG
jgi:hypothetical protein